MSISELFSNSSAFVTLSATLNDSVTGSLDQSTQIGAIAGRNNAAITNVSATATISVQLNATVSNRAVFGAQIGGLVGLSDSGSNIAGSSSRMLQRLMDRGVRDATQALSGRNTWPSRYIPPKMASALTTP